MNLVKKDTFIEGDYYTDDTYNCPNHGDSEFVIDPFYKFCPHCGIFLDWSEVKGCE